MASISSSVMLFSRASMGAPSSFATPLASRALSTPMAMSGDCLSIATMTAHVFALNPIAPSTYPISRMASRAIFWKSMFACVVISPIMRTRPVVTAVSQATRLFGSCSRHASRTASEMASHTLSGCPSVTDSDVKKRLSPM